MVVNVVSSSATEGCFSVRKSYIPFFSADFKEILDAILFCLMKFQRRKETELSKFTIVPGPVPIGESVWLDVNEMEPGSYRLAIVNSAGNDVQISECLITRQTKTILLPTDLLPAGPYFVQLTNLLSGKIFREILLVP